VKETTKTKANRMFTRYQHYYVRYGGIPIATVMVGIRKGTGKVCRGISIGDKFDAAEGQMRALGRMIKAAENRKNDLPIVTSDQRLSSGTKVGPESDVVDRFVTKFGEMNQRIAKYKSGYDVVPTKKEVEILRK
jgi:hypothetical protein